MVFPGEALSPFTLSELVFDDQLEYDRQFVELVGLAYVERSL